MSTNYNNYTFNIFKMNTQVFELPQQIKEKKKF